MFVNLAYLLDRPTGTTSYALNLLPYLEALSPLYLATPASGLTSGQACILPTPTNMTAAEGATGHLRRLLWTQFRLPSLLNPKLFSPSHLHKTDCSFEKKQTNQPVHFSPRKPLLFTPIPEAPIDLLSRPSFRSVVTFHDLIPLRFPSEFGAIKYFFRYYVPQVLAQAEKVICNSEATARDIIDFYGISAHKLAPIPLAYDQHHFRPAVTRPSILDGLKLNDTPYFLTLGRQAPYKNIAAVIAALAQVPNTQLLIAGPTDPRYTPELEKVAVEKGVRSRVKFLSYVPYSQLPALLSHAIALVFPSLWEGFGLPVLEAMACATPVITSNIASLPEVAGDAAYLIDPYRLTELTGAMSEIATDSSTRQQLREAGLQRAQAFSWEKTGTATIEILRPFA